MLVRAKLFATLTRYLPGMLPGTPTEVELPEGATVADLLARLGVPSAEARMFFVNGRVRPANWVLQANDEVAIFPPIGGG